MKTQKRKKHRRDTSGRTQKRTNAKKNAGTIKSAKTQNVHLERSANVKNFNSSAGIHKTSYEIPKIIHYFPRWAIFQKRSRLFKLVSNS